MKTLEEIDLEQLVGDEACCCADSNPAAWLAITICCGWRMLLCERHYRGVLKLSELMVHEPCGHIGVPRDLLKLVKV